MFILVAGHYFKDITALSSARVVVLINQKNTNDRSARAAYFDACAKYYYSYLRRKKIKAKMVGTVSECKKYQSTGEAVHFYDPVNNNLEADIKKTFPAAIMLETLGFINTKADLLRFYKQNKTLRQTSFYIYSRKRLQILMDRSGKPIGGKYSYDSDNREKIKADDMGKIPSPGSVPTDHKSAEKWLDEFLRRKLKYFGKYQDAIVNTTSSKHIFLFHSGISPMLNMGLLTPDYVIKRTLSYYKHNTRSITINNIEGFIRQIIGWREHCRLTYVVNYKEMRAANVLNGKINVSNWGAAVIGVAPVDDAVKKMTEHGYLHHIERLMIVGSFMLMMGANPDSAMKWFLHSGIDAYEWNMLNNVKIMAMYAMGTKSYTTKPYIASSNYILKMSNYKKDGHWELIWDALYWEFIRKNQSLIKHNPRLAIQIKLYKNKSKKQKMLYRTIKQKFLSGKY